MESVTDDWDGAWDVASYKLTCNENERYYDYYYEFFVIAGGVLGGWGLVDTTVFVLLGGILGRDHVSLSLILNNIKLYDCDSNNTSIP